MPPTADALLEEMIQKGLQKVAHKDLVKGCDYLIVSPGIESPVWAFRMANYVEGDTFSNWRDYVKLDKDGDPLFEYTASISIRHTKMKAHGVQFYTYNPFKCDAEVVEAKGRFKGGRRTRKSKRVRRRTPHRRNT